MLKTKQLFFIRKWRTLFGIENDETAVRTQQCLIPFSMNIYTNVNVNNV
jgi:hypothetical protein